MEKGRGKGTDTFQTENVFTRKEYIEREAVKSAIYEIMDKYDPYDRCDSKAITALQRADDAIDLIPAADVVPVRHGKWETAFLAHEYLGCRPYAHYCSVCHQIIAFRTFYCPNCGALMDKDGDIVGCYIDRHFIEKTDEKYQEHLLQEAASWETWMLETEQAEEGE